MGIKSSPAPEDFFSKAAGGASCIANEMEGSGILFGFFLFANHRLFLLFGGGVGVVGGGVEAQ
jgi:hypothetical protein